MYGNTKLALLPILCVCENLESSFFETKLELLALLYNFLRR